MIYNRPTQQQMNSDVERIFVKKDQLNNDDRAKVVFDKYLRELRSDTKVVSNSFTFSFPKIGQDGEARLYLIPNK